MQIWTCDVVLKYLFTAWRRLRAMKKTRQFCLLPWFVTKSSLLGALYWQSGGEGHPDLDTSGPILKHPAPDEKHEYGGIIKREHSQSQRLNWSECRCEQSMSVEICIAKDRLGSSLRTCHQASFVRQWITSMHSESAARNVHRLQALHCMQWTSLSTKCSVERQNWI